MQVSIYQQLTVLTNYMLNTLADKPKMDFPLFQFILCYLFLKILECILMELHLYKNAFVSV